MKLRLCLLVILLFTLAACSQATPTPQVIVVTATEAVTNTPVPTNTSTATITPLPSPTRTSTPTRQPTNTPTETVEPVYATQTALAAEREATRAFKQRIDDIRSSCPAIDWVELSEVAYAKEHEGECVYIRVVISDINFEEELLDAWIGYYSATLVIGLDDLNNQSGRLTDSMWLNVYGRVSTTSWIWTDKLTDKVTSAAGIQAQLIEGPNGLSWVHE